MILMIVLGTLKLGGEFQRLTLDQSPLGAIDLKHRYREVQTWFAGNPIYDTPIIGTYPPASHVILYPLLGWLPFNTARWVWAGASLIALIWLALLTVRESRAGNRLERPFAVLMFLSLNAVGGTVGNGQIGLYVLPLILTGLLILDRKRVSWLTDLTASILFLTALVKPNITVPFFWIILFTPGRIRPALLVAGGYAALTLFSVSFQDAGILIVITEWLRHASATCLQSGYADLYALLSALGLGKYDLIGSFLVLTVLGWWVYSHRKADLWLRLGVTALVARFWTYHGLYDDVLILLPMIALFRLAKAGPSPGGRDVVAGSLLALLITVMLVPARLHYFWGPPWPRLFAWSHALVWATVLIFLIMCAGKERADDRDYDEIGL